MPQSCWAKFEFVAENEDELYFGVGEKIEILERDEAYGDGWWRVRLGWCGRSRADLIRDGRPTAKKGCFQCLTSQRLNLPRRQLNPP
jgi:hypothetical protein